MRGISALRFLSGSCKPCGNLLLFFLFSFFLEIKFVDEKKNSKRTDTLFGRSIVREARRIVALRRTPRI